MDRQQRVIDRINIPAAKAEIIKALNWPDALRRKVLYKRLDACTTYDDLDEFEWSNLKATMHDREKIWAVLDRMYDQIVTEDTAVEGRTRRVVFRDDDDKIVNILEIKPDSLFGKNGLPNAAARDLLHAIFAVKTFSIHRRD